MRLIDADALFDVLYLISWGTEMDTEPANEFMEMINSAPSIEAKPVEHGRWIEGKGLEKCSVCCKKGFPDWNYCPNCGARMDGGPT